MTSKSSNNAVRRSEIPVAIRMKNLRFQMLKPLKWNEHVKQEEFIDLLKSTQLHNFFTMELSHLFTVHGRLSEEDKEHCQSFISTYNKEDRIGKVKGQSVSLDPSVLARVLHLPQGNLDIEDVPKPTDEQVVEMFHPGERVKVVGNGYIVKHIKDPSFQQLVTWINARFCSKANHIYVKERIFNAAKFIWETREVLNWAGFLSDTTKTQCGKVQKTTQERFHYAEYLLKVIHSHLGISQGDPHVAHEDTRLTDNQQVSAGNDSSCQGNATSFCVPHDLLVSQSILYQSGTTQNREHVQCTGNLSEHSNLTMAHQGPHNTLEHPTAKGIEELDRDQGWAELDKLDSNLDLFNDVVGEAETVHLNDLMDLTFSKEEEAFLQRMDEDWND